MKRLTYFRFKRTTAIGFLLIVQFALYNVQILAHGGEDHGDAKPKTQTTGKGTVSHSSRLGALEVLFKHPLFKPDETTEARLFVTKYENNEAFKDVSPAVEIESANGGVTAATVERTETGGVFTVKFQALPTGTYTIRAKLTHGGETDTVTFSGIEVKDHPATAAETGGMSWLRTILIGFVGLTVLALFGALLFFVFRFSSAGEAHVEETVSA